VFGFSVQTHAGLTVAQLAAACVNKSVGYSTVGEIRMMGYDVVRTSGDGHHGTVVVPFNWNADAAYRLALIFRHAINPAPKQRD
jgi:hypothetical protein